MNLPDFDFDKEYLQVWQRWKTNSKRDLFDAVLQKEKDLESWRITPASFPKEWKEPPFLIPTDEMNAEVINDILKKSWETQAGMMESLSQLSCFTIHGLLKYYFDCFGM